MEILGITDDLIFSSKIESAAIQLGVPVRLIASPSRLPEALAGKMYRLILVDLNLSNGVSIDIVRTLRSQLPQAPIVGYCSHVQIELQEQALQAGCTQVLPRSAFVRQLPELLK